MKIINRGLIVFTSMAITGCAATPFAIDSCDSHDVALSEISPPKHNARKIVFLDFDDSKTGHKDFGLGMVLESKLEAMVNKTGAEIADSSLAEQLSSEIRRYEVRGTSNYRSNLATDAIEGEIIGATLSSSFTKREYIKNVDGSGYWREASCSFNAEVTGNLKIYSINPLSLTEIIPLEGSKKVSIEMSNSRCPLPAGQDKALYQDAVRDITSSKKFKKSIYANLRQIGYVREVRLCDDDKNNYIWLSTKPDQGAKNGSSVAIYKQYWFEDKINDTRVLRRKQVAEGEIVPTSDPDEAWVQIKDREAIKQVRLGDLTEITQHSCTMQFQWMCDLIDF
jgi:hypothetical protein